MMMNPELLKNPLPYLGGYVRMITAFHAEFERQIRGEQSAFYRQYLGLRDYFFTMRGKKSYSPYQLMHMEIAGTRDLIQTLKPVKAHAKQALSQIERYIRDQDYGFHQSSLQEKKAKGQTKYYANTIEQKESLIDKLNSIEKEWPAAKDTIRELRRQNHQAISNYRIAKDRRYFYEINELPVDSAEYMMRDTLLLTNRIEDAARGYLDRLENLLPLFLNISEQAKHADKMRTALDSLEKDAEKIIVSSVKSSDRVDKGYGRTVKANQNTAEEMSVFEQMLRRFDEES